MSQQQSGPRVPTRSETTFRERRSKRGQERMFGSPTPCSKCDRPLHEHERHRRYPDHGPSGSYHYVLFCPS